MDQEKLRTRILEIKRAIEAQLDQVAQLRREYNIVRAAKIRRGEKCPMFKTPQPHAGEIQRLRCTLSYYENWESRKKRANEYREAHKEEINTRRRIEKLSPQE